MANFTVGGKDFLIGEMSFITLERAWDDILLATSSLHPIKGMSACISVLASCMMELPEFSPEEWGLDMDPGQAEELIHRALCVSIKRKLTVKEMVHVRSTMMTVLQEGGLEITEGELQGLADLIQPVLNLGETAPDTLLNSLPPELKEEAGIG